jgi:hypothetical protein
VGDTVVQRQRRAVDQRGVTVRTLDDGLAILTAVVPEWIAHAIYDRLTQMAAHITDARRHDPEPEQAGRTDSAASSSDARTIISDDGGTFAVDPDAGVAPASTDTRTTDQLRADILSDLLLAAAPSDVLGSALAAVRAHVQVTIAATTLAGVDEAPADLDGHGPLDPDVARGLAARAAGWSRLFLDAGGHVTRTDSYTPTAGMKRFLRARDQRCRFPGCRTPVHRCDIDHNHDHAKGGATALDNLAHLCRDHHMLKHPDIPGLHRWTAKQLPDGTLTWTSPLGRSYRDCAPRRVMFT